MSSLRLRWHPGYALGALLVFLIEVIIALWVRDAFVRPYLGDVLAVVLVYLGLRAITSLSVLAAALIAFGIGVLVEIGQAINILATLGLADNRTASIILGTSFSFGDIICYASGALIAILGEHWRSKGKLPKS